MAKSSLHFNDLSDSEQLYLHTVRQLGENAFGGEIRHMVESQTKTSVSTGHAYAVLTYLEARGWLTSELVDIQKEARWHLPQRRYALAREIPKLAPPPMRAKFRISFIERHRGPEDQGFPYDVLSFNPVYKPDYEDDAFDEDNTFAKYTPSADLRMTINNPALVGQYEEGDTFYLDFTPVRPAEPVAPENEDYTP